MTDLEDITKQMMGFFDKEVSADSYTKKLQEQSNFTHKDIPGNKKTPSLEDGHAQNISGMWTLKNDINSPKF